jgi:hypothetical protein
MHLVLSVKTDDALKVETETSVEQLKAALKDKNITVNGRADSLTQFTIDGVQPNDDASSGRWRIRSSGLVRSGSGLGRHLHVPDEAEHREAAAAPKR